MRWYKIFFGTFLLAFFSLVGFSSSVYAVEDISYTFTSVPSRYDTVVPLCDGDCLNDYQYLIIESSGSPFDYAGTSDIKIRFNGSSFSSLWYSVVSSKSIYSLPFNGSSNNHMEFGPSIDWGTHLPVTFTLTNTLDTPCPEPDPCPEPEQCPEASDTPYAEKFDNIEKAIYTCGAILIMLYFFYCIYRMIIKGSGVN